MANFLYVNIPAHGHVNPSLSIVPELIAHGHKVYYLNSSSFKDKVQQSGAEFIPYPQTQITESDLKFADFVAIGCQLQLMAFEIVPKILDQIKSLNINLVVRDSTCPLGKYIAQILKVNAVSVNSMLALENHFYKYPILWKEILFGVLRNLKLLINMRVKQYNFAKKYKIKLERISDTYSTREALTIVCTSRQIQPYSNLYGNNYIFVGQLYRQEPQIDLAIAGKKIIYVSLGTIHNSNVTFYKNCIQAFGQLPDYQTIISIGKKVDIKTFTNVPQNILLLNSAPQQQILKNCRLFITHCGANSMHEALANAVPMLMFPQQAEQLLNAKRVQQLNCGKILTNTNDPQKILQQSLNVIYDTNIKTALNQVSEDLKNCGGTKLAVQKILEFAK